MTARAFVTGATGYVGTALAARLADEGWRVRGLVRRTSDAGTVRWLAERGVELVFGDVTERETVRSAVDGADVVFHCAAVIGYRRRTYGAMSRTNVHGTGVVAEACLAAGVGRLVHVSSIAAVGCSSDPELLNEDTPWNADVLDAPYFDTKHAAEARVLSAVDRGLDATIVNPAAIYGPSAVPSNSSRLISQIARGSLSVAPEGGINVVPLETVVEGIVAAARLGRTGRRVVLGGENLSVLNLVVRAARAAGRELSPRTIPSALAPLVRLGMTLVEPWVPDRVWFTPDMCAMFGRWMWFDCSRMERELGVSASSVDACLEATVAQLRRDGRI